MKLSTVPVVKDVVLVGAGHAHVGVLRDFAMTPQPGVRLTLITREVHTPYSGMLPGLVAGVYQFDEAHIDCGPLAAFAGARLYQDEVIGLDLSTRRVLCKHRPPVPYDVLSIDIGSTPATGAVAGLDAHTVPVKPIDGFLRRFERVRDAVLTAGGKASVAVVGGGAGGVELILAMAQRLREDVRKAGLDARGLTFTLVSGSPTLLPAMPARMGACLAATLATRDIAVLCGARVTGVDARALHLSDGREHAADIVVWTTQAKAAPWLRDTGLALDADGFIRVSATLQSVSHPGVFAAGDIATVDGAPRPKSGVFAVRQGKPLSENLRRFVAQRRLVQHRAQRDAMYLLATADGRAVGTRNGFVFEGAWVWRWKDRIDRRFMQMFNALPEMPASEAPALHGVADAQAMAEISAAAMRCGGCGAKVGASVLSRTLGSLVPAIRSDVMAGLDEPDDAAIIDTGGTQLSVHTVDYFRAIIDDPYLFGKIAANHALGDVFAMGAAPQSALAIATVPYGLEVKVEADLSAMMTGANEVLRAAGCALAGGHTSEGAELALGFAVTGLVARDAALRKGGLRPGDALILTKPVGTGALLAAHMRAKAKARWVFDAIAHMQVSNGPAARVLRAHGARAMTDVTGFGLIGHLAEMLRASACAARLSLPDVPLLDGLQETMARGIFSSLQPQNVRLRRSISNLDVAAAAPTFPALFDPQTAGGLLAGIPRENVAACLTALEASGYARARVVGIVEVRADPDAPITVVDALDL